MGRTTNILDLNNRLEKVEKENVAQNNYNSLKNRPKINGNLLTGDKTGTQLGLAEAQDIADINTAIGNMSDLETTATNLVGAINEINGKIFNTGIADGLFCYVQPNTGNTIIGVRSIALGKNIGIQITSDGTLSRYEEPYS